MTARISTAGVLGSTAYIIQYIYFFDDLFHGLPGESVVGTGIFIVAGGAIITYSILTRNPEKICYEQDQGSVHALSVE